MSTIQTNLFTINGVVSTDKSVLQNINTLCTACGAWMTYDIAEGKWAVVINRAGSSIASFNDSNIIGGINVSGTGINDLYNTCSVEFPHKDLRDQTDYVDLEIDDVTWQYFPNELPKNMDIKIDIINDPIQAAYIGTSELKQSRVDKVIQFRTDYSKIGLKAGDLIDVTAEMYGYSAKMFRITKIEEDDGDVLAISITALEYSEDIYSTTGLTRKLREKKTGIVPKAANTALTNLDNQASLKLAVTPSAQEQGISLFYSAAASAGLAATTWYVDYAGKKVTIAASDVVIAWKFTTGSDLDIRCAVVSPNVGQNTIANYLGYTTESLEVWPTGGTKGSSGTAYIEWGLDNQGSGEETVRVDIDRMKAAFPTKRYFAIECRGNWYGARGSTPVTLQATLYEGGTTTGTGEPTYSFTNTGSTRSRVLDSQGVYVDSFYGPLLTFANLAAFPANGIVAEQGPNAKANVFYAQDTGFIYRWNGSAYVITDQTLHGATAPGDLMGYFVWDNQTNQGQFLQTLPPGITA
jgi:hypothetical protein